VIGTLGIVLAPSLLGAMGASPSVVANGAGFTRVMLGGNAVIMMLFLINAVFRGAGDAAIAMRVLWLANAINIALGPLLIFGVGPFPRLGVTGAAIATTIGRGAGALFAFTRLLRPGARIELSRRHARLDPSLMVRLVRLSGSGTFQVFIGTASWIGLVRIISSFGSTALAGYTIGVRIILFALLPSWGMSNAAATLVGQNLGARRVRRAERTGWITTGLATAVAAAAVLGVGTALAYPTLLAAVSDAAAPRDRARANGIYRFWRDTGLVAGALLGGFAADAVGSTETFAVVAAVTAASGLALARPRPSRLRPAYERRAA
jgi:Na+-driven multidrug efflux pump